MNALDALFTRQVPTKAPGPSVGATGRDRSAGESATSFASALSGRSNKPETNSRDTDTSVAAAEDSVDEQTDITEVSEEDDDARKAVDLLELFGQRAAKTEDEPEPEKESSEDEIVIDDDPILLEDVPLNPEMPAAADADAKAEQRVDGEASTAAILAQSKAVPGTQQERLAKTEQTQAATGTGAARGAVSDGAAAMQAGASGGGDAQAGADDQPRGKTETAALETTSKSAQPMVRSEGDTAIEGVEVLEKRSVNAPAMSQNGENVAKAIFREANGLVAAQHADAAEAGTTRAAVATERADAAFTARPTGQTLHTLRIQLNPESLGQVTAVMRLVDGELQVNLKVQNADAYRQLSDDSTSIAKALRAHGFGIDQITVQHAGASDRGGMNPQQGQSQNSSQQFQLREGAAQNAGGGNGEGGARRDQAGGGRQHPGELSHEAVSGTAGPSRRADGVYL